jgi:hypothetical protein
MKWQHGLVTITRPEHWELAAKHLWGLSRADLAAYLLPPPPGILHPTDESKKARPLEAPEAPAIKAKAASR